MTWAGALLLLAGVAVLVGWKARIPALTSVLPTLVPVEVLSAVLLLGWGVGMVALALGQRRTAAAVGGAVCAVAALLFLQDLADLRFGLERAVARLWLESPDSAARVAAHAAAAFLFSGLALALHASPRMRFPSALLASLVCTLGGVVLLGHVLGIRQLFPGAPLRSMALIEALGFAVGGYAMASEALARIRAADGARPSWRAPLVAAVAVTLGTLLLWQQLREQELRQIRQTTRASASSVASEVSRRVALAVEALRNLGAWGVENGWESNEDWRSDARLGLASVPGIQSVEWIDRQLETRIVTPVPPQPRALADTAEASALRLRALQRVLESHEPAVAGPFPYRDGGRALRVVVPVLAAGGGLDAFIAGQFDADEMFRFVDNVAPGYVVRVRCDDRDVYLSGERPSPLGPTLRTRSGMEFFGNLPWEVELAPGAELLSRQRSALPEAVLAAGLLIAALMASTLWFGQQARLRAERFRAAVRERTSELERTQAVGRMLSAKHDVGTIVQGVTEAGRDLTGAEFAAFFALPGESDTVAALAPPSADAVGPAPPYALWALAGVARARFDDVPPRQAVALLTPALEGGGTLRCRDARTDPRHADGAPFHDLPPEHPLRVRSYLAVPVISASGRVWGGILFGHRRPGVFTRASVEVAESLAAQAAIALDNASLLQAERVARAEAQRAVESKDRFMSVLSHELRNPMGSIRSALEVLERGAGDARAETRMRDILERQVQHLAALVDDLLDATRISSDRLALDLARLDLCELVENTVDAARLRLGGRDIRLELDNADGPVWVEADRKRIAQALDNLLTNARRFTPDGGRVVVSLEADEDAGEAVLRVRDTGIGIDRDDLQRVFEPFRQAAGRRSAGGTGLGLGLAIVDGFVHAHGGRVDADSPGLGKGSTFTIRLPLREAPSHDASDDADLAADEERAIRAPRRVLVIDDHRDSLTALSQLLSLYGQEVRTADDGESGLDRLEEFAADAVICDIDLPGIDGYEVARRIRADARFAGIRLFALTGHGEDESIERARRAGFDEHLTKPVDSRRLRELVLQA